MERRGMKSYAMETLAVEVGIVETRTVQTLAIEGLLVEIGTAITLHAAAASLPDALATAAGNTSCRTHCIGTG